MNEKFNTMRALQEKPLLVTSRGCRFGWHKWTQWSEGQWIKDRWGHSNWTQTRACAHCNAMSSRRVRV